MAWTNPRTWVSGETVTAALLNLHLRDNLKAIGDPWTSYTPTLANITLGNGTLTAAYSRAGSLVNFRINFILGSSSSVGSSPSLSLPFAALVNHTPGMAGVAYDVSSTPRIPLGGFASTTVVFPIGPGGLLSATVPFTWAVGDELAIGGTYEAA